MAKSPEQRAAGYKKGGANGAKTRKLRAATSTKTVANVSVAAGQSDAPKPGRPTKLDVKTIDQARKLCSLGATEAELAYFFEVSIGTIRNWRVMNSDFATAMALGKEHSDARVEQSLFARAVGFEHPAVKIFIDQRTGRTLEHHYTERFAPDTNACMFWLKNRKPEVWRDKFDLPAVPPEEGALIAQEAVAKAMATVIREVAGVAPHAVVKAG